MSVDYKKLLYDKDAPAPERPEGWETRPNKYIKCFGGTYRHRVLAESLLGCKLATDELVHHRNGVKWDNRPENLLIVSRSEHTTEHLKEDSWLTAKTKKRTHPIIAYNLDGTIYKEYQSVRDAVRDGNSNSAIYSCLSGATKYYRNLIWKYKYPDAVKAESKNKHRQISAFSAKTGELVYVFNSLSDTHKIGGFNTFSVSNCCNRKSRRYADLIWRYSDDCSDVQTVVDACNKSDAFRNARIECYDKYTGALVASYNNIKEAVAADPRYSAKGIGQACDGTRKHYLGYTWKRII